MGIIGELEKKQKNNPTLISITKENEDEDNILYSKRNFEDVNVPDKEIVVLDKDYDIHKMLQKYDEHLMKKIDFLNSIVVKYKDKIDVLKDDIKDLQSNVQQEENKKQIEVIDRDIEKLRSERDEKLKESFEISIPLEPAVELRMDRFINKQKE